MKVSQILTSKGTDVVTVSPEASVSELVGLLREHNIGACVVATDDAAVAGIVSERDVVRRLAVGPGTMESPVRSIMSTDVTTVGVDSDVRKLAELMTHRRIRHLPVVTDGLLVGIVSIGDVVKSRIDQLEFERDQLESYVSQP